MYNETYGDGLFVINLKELRCPSKLIVFSFYCPRCIDKLATKIKTLPKEFFHMQLHNKEYSKYNLFNLLLR